MARGKVQVRLVENPVHRQVTFCKRRTGLLKKARELSVMCDADVGLIIFSSNGKLFELATNGTMLGLIERYMGSCGGSQTESEVSKPQEAEQEMFMLKQEIERLQKELRCMFGKMTLEDLHSLEGQLEMWTCDIRAAKMERMVQEIQSLRNKEGILTAANDILREKIIEQNFTQIGQHGVFNPQVIGDISYPLTLQEQIFEQQTYLQE